jgi:monooxygenase
MNAMNPPQDFVDVLIVGAGISGIGMAAHLVEQCPERTFAILDRRERPGGTWDLFRYPGIRSDSDMHTFAYAFAPWREPSTIASAEQIRDYLDGVIAERGIATRLRFGRQVESADWDSKAGLWTVIARREDGEHELHRCRFLFLGTGYYDYDDPHDAALPGLADFAGTVVHPQFWPESLDYGGKRVIVVGSGATAVTLVPAMAESAGHVTMLQRTPTWYGVRPSRDRLASLVRKLLPDRAAWAVNRAKALLLHELLWRRARSRPDQVGRLLKDMVRAELGEAWNEADFTPPYNPWEQRLCLVPDGDMFAAMREGRASIVTGEIDRIVPHGIRLRDSRELPADLIVTATGLRLATLGKIAVSLDGRPVDPARHFWYRDCMLSNVPNFAVLFGYLNAGWTLRVDIVADRLCRLLKQMAAWKATVVTPVLPADHGLIEARPFAMFSSGYLERGKHLIPKSATTAPWRIAMDYRSDKREMHAAPLDDGVLRFERSPALA